MSKFNTAVQTGPDTTNRAGGEAFSLNDQMTLVSEVLTSLVKPRYYRSESVFLSDLRDRLSRVDPLFAAKLAVYARTKFNMRSISHVIAAWVAKNIKNEYWLQAFFDKIVVRVDDMTEIISLYQADADTRSNGKIKLPGSLKRGFRRAFNRFNGYQLAKYKMEGKQWSLIDVVNMIRPIPTAENAEALRQLVADELRQTDTWESMMSAAEGNKADVSRVWHYLLTENKLGYMALLRNLRNIYTQADSESLDIALGQLTDPERVAKSRQLPFRFSSAYEQLYETEPKVLAAVSDAMDISVRNVPKLDNTVVVLDVSGSMKGQPINIGSVFAAALVKSCEADLVTFSGEAVYEAVNPRDSVISIANALKKGVRWTGTDFKPIFTTLKRSYDRIIVLSDMQGWIQFETPVEEVKAYKKRFDCDPWIYSFDLAGFGTSQFKLNDKLLMLAGFSEKVLSLMHNLEKDPSAMINDVLATVI